MIVGHRGASGYEPENTLRSFDYALKLGIPAIELDVYICASGELVVIHDGTVDRTTNGHGAVASLTLDQLCSLDAGKGEQIPQLFQVLNLVSRRAVIDIELKGPGTAQPVADLINQYVNNKNWQYADFIVSSFDHYAILEFHKYCPLVKIGVILCGIPIGRAVFAQSAQAQYAIMSYESIDKEFVDDAHKRGIQVFVYTVDTIELADKLRIMGVDGIISNYPDKFIG